MMHSFVLVQLCYSEIKLRPIYGFEVFVVFDIVKRFLYYFSLGCDLLNKLEVKIHDPKIFY